MTLPKPETGLVVRYSYLWLREHQEGREEGVKDRPCAIILTTLDQDEKVQVLVVPVTHSPPDTGAEALELPQVVKRHIGLDTERSWVVLSESNFFDWPGPDLRRVGDHDNSSVAYGFLPPRFFAEMQRRFLRLEADGRSKRITRTE